MRRERDAFDRILASLHEAMLDDAHWLPTSALHVSPVGGGHMDFRPRHVAALVLIVDPAPGAYRS